MRIEHLAMFVNDLEGAREFFVKYFGVTHKERFHNPKTGLSTYFLYFEDGARLEIMNLPEMNDLEKSYARTGFTHLAISVGSREKVDELTARMKADGYRVHSGPRVTLDGYYESCIYGFEDNLIEVTI